MQNWPTISVLVITYNHEDYIRQTLDSIVCQSGNFDLEVVVANDCSTDNTDAVIHDFIGQYRGGVSINYFSHDENKGILPNLLFALSQCKGDYLAICEGDDFWLSKDKLQKQAAFYRQHHDCSMVITNRKVIREDNSSYDELYQVFYKKDFFSVPDIIGGFIPGTQTIFAANDRELLTFLSAHKDLTHADRYIAYFFALRGNIYVLPEITAAYRLTGKGAWSANNGLRKLQVKAEQLEDFHRRIGLPINNATLAKTQLACWWATLKYCTKRPGELKDPINRSWILNTWRKFPHTNRMNIMWQVIFDR